MELKPGSRLGPYKIVSPLGGGGMGRVWLAEDATLGRKIAIKTLTDALQSNEAALQRFEREARSASALNHPNVITIYELSLSGDPPWIAMELVDGDSLRQVIAAEAPLSLRRTLQIVSQIADGLAAAHDKGIVHRDLKPENIMISKDGFVKVLDFGLAKPLPLPDSDDSTVSPGHSTHPGTIVGTVAYMSPEQARGGVADFRSDQFALGIILYEMLTGRRPFHRASAAETLTAIIREDPEPLASLAPDSPAPLRWVVDRCLQKDPRGRYASTRDLERDLQNLRTHLSDASNPDVAVPAADKGKLPRSKVLAATAIVLILVIAMGWFVTQETEPPLLTPATSSADSNTRYLSVLPFAETSDQSETALIAQGMSAMLRADLSRVSGLQVVSIDSTPSGATAISRARTAGATLALDGNLQQLGDQIRVSWSILSVPDGRVVSGDTVTGSSRDLFAIQDQISNRITRFLDVQGRPSAPDSVETGSSDHQLEYLKAVGYLQRYDNEASIDGAIRILETLSEDSAIVQAALGRAYLHKFQLTRDPAWADLAVRACERAATIDPQNPEVRVTLGEVRLLNGRVEEAADQFRRAVAQQPNLTFAHLGLARAVDRLGNIEEAERHYHRAIALEPGSWVVHNHFGAFNAGIGDMEEAESEFSRVVELSPDNSRGYSNLGAVRLQLGRHDDAVAALRKSIDIQPTSSALSNLGTAFFRLRRYDEAADAYRRAISLTPDDYRYWIYLGDAIRWGAGNAGAEEAYDRAIELAERELALDPRSASTHAQLGVALAKRGRISEARAHSAKAVSLDPEDPTVRYEQAVVANLGGDYSQATSLLRSLIDEGWGLEQIKTDPELANLKIFASEETNSPNR